MSINQLLAVGYTPQIKYQQIPNQQSPKRLSNSLVFGAAGFRPMEAEEYRTIQNSRKKIVELGILALLKSSEILSLIKTAKLTMPNWKY